MGQLIGLARLGRDAQVRDTNESRVANLSLAFDYRNKGEKGTTWVDAALWGKQAEALEQYLVKGKLLFVVVDDIHLATFTKADGTDSVKLAGRVSKLELAAGGERAPVPAPAPPPPPRPAPPKAAPAGGGFDDIDDDIPF